MTVFRMYGSYQFRWEDQILTGIKHLERAEQSKEGSEMGRREITAVESSFMVHCWLCAVDLNTPLVLTGVESSCFLFTCTSLFSLIFPVVSFLLLHYVSAAETMVAAVCPQVVPSFPWPEHESATSTWIKYSGWYWLCSFPLLGCGAINYLITEQKQPCFWIYTSKPFIVPGGINVQGKGPKLS